MKRTWTIIGAANVCQTAVIIIILAGIKPLEEAYRA
jgi:hypothetical protein